MAESDSTRMSEWVIQIEEKLGNIRTKEKVPKSERRRMHRAPANVRKERDDSDVYRPKRVSFGPYFHGNESCLAREQDKEDSLLYFLRRTPAKPLEHFLKALAEVVDELRDAYEQLDPVWQRDTDAFLRMMLLDGCFLVELVNEGKDPLRFVRSWSDYYSFDNPIISRIYENPSEKECYFHDMLLLENQVPFMLLERLLIAETDRNRPIHYENWSEFLQDRITKTFYPTRNISTSIHIKFLHILDVYRKSLVYPNIWRGKELKRREGRTEFHFNIPSATELHDVGIGFTTSSSASLTDISFRHQKTLMVPQIIVDGATKSRFLNVIAFEQVHKGVGKELTTCVYFMGCLIRGANDVSLLQSRGIINTTLSNGEVATLFSRITKDIFLDPDDPSAYEYVEVGRKLRERFNKMSNEWRKDLHQNYLKSPWAIISVIGAILLFTLTIIQTVYTVLSYVNRNN